MLAGIELLKVYYNILQINVCWILNTVFHENLKLYQIIVRSYNIWIRVIAKYNFDVILYFLCVAVNW